MKVIFEIPSQSFSSSSSGAGEATKIAHSVVFEVKPPNDSVHPGKNEETCLSIKKNGERCSGIPNVGDSYCFFHKSTCTAITSKGTKCSNGCMEGEKFCGYHAATCPGKTKSGQQCQLAKEFCRYHQQYQQEQLHQQRKRENVNDDDDDDDEMVGKEKNQHSSKGSKVRCQGKTKKGLQCRLTVPDGVEFCHFHQ